MDHNKLHECINCESPKKQTKSQRTVESRNIEKYITDMDSVEQQILNSMLIDCASKLWMEKLPEMIALSDFIEEINKLPPFAPLTQFINLNTANTGIGVWHVWAEFIRWMLRANDLDSQSKRLLQSYQTTPEEKMKLEGAFIAWSGEGVCS